MTITRPEAAAATTRKRGKNGSHKKLAGGYFVRRAEERTFDASPAAYQVAMVAKRVRRVLTGVVADIGSESQRDAFRLFLLPKLTAGQRVLDRALCDFCKKSGT